MLAVVNQPHIEISLNGEGSQEIVNWISKKFSISIIHDNDDDEKSVPIEQTDFWKEMNKNRVGHLIAGRRLKVDLTQKQLAEKVGITQNMISDYESGRRRVTKRMAVRIAYALGVHVDKLN